MNGLYAIVKQVWNSFLCWRRCIFAEAPKWYALSGYFAIFIFELGQYNGCCCCCTLHHHGPLTRYAKLQVAHAPGMPGTFSPAADFEGNRYLAIPACITARAWRTCRDACRDRLPAVTGKTFPAFPAHAHPQFCVSGKRPMALAVMLLAMQDDRLLVFQGAPFTNMG